jgi:hypothetical protein
MDFCITAFAKKTIWTSALFILTLTPLYAANGPQQGGPSGVNVGKTHGFINFRMGVNFPNAAGEQFGQITNQLTLEKKDFRAGTYGFDIGAAFKSHYALAFGWEYSSASPASEFRHFVEDNGNPITQTTHFRQMPITATFRYYPGKMGEEVGSYIWMPARIAPYIAVGGGFMYYSISQKGDFVNTNPSSPNYLAILEGDLKSSGIVPAGHLAAGFDISISSRFFANFEARYTFAHAHLSQDFSTIKEAMDLKGLKTTGSIGVRF